MKLDDFVSETIKQIIQGVVSAQEFGNSKNAKVNPLTSRLAGQGEGQAYCEQTGVPLQQVKFDVAVTVTEETSNSEGGESIGSISVSPAVTISTQNSSISRIKFEVPVLLPTTGAEAKW
ncbi:MAG: hypothetical protein HRU20_14965 [Pseudomonadales bacterium]|nr:hypothetical protein [Pseudomonadales bacterium]